jgi:hypothetical protein
MLNMYFLVFLACHAVSMHSIAIIVELLCYFDSQLKKARHQFTLFDMETYCCLMGTCLEKDRGS